MHVHFWGTRGSIPASLDADHVREKIRQTLEIAARKGLSAEDDIDAFIDNELPFHARGTYGTNTPCVEIRDGNDIILCDAGTGLRDFGNSFLKTHDGASPTEFHILISHLHWDHIQGFPFFTPAFMEGNQITIYGCHKDMQKAFAVQQGSPFFPICFDKLGAEIRFVELVPGTTYEINGFTVSAIEQNHPGVSCGYRVEKGKKVTVYSTDSEHKSENEEDSHHFVEFFRRADLLIFDAQYSLADASTVKKDWGHSINFIGVELAQQAGVKHLCLFHNEPTSTDEKLDKFLLDTQRLASLLNEDTTLQISIARDGLVIAV